MKGAAGSAIGELARARLALDERGQKLGELDEKTARMMASAEAFSKHAHEVSYEWIIFIGVSHQIHPPFLCFGPVLGLCWLQNWSRNTHKNSSQGNVFTTLPNLCLARADRISVLLHLFF